MLAADISDLAILGGEPRFKKPVGFSLMNLPERQKFEKAFRDIFDRKYYTNHGPLTQKFEDQLAAFLNVRHAVTMVNGTIARILSAKALNLSGKIIVPALAPIPYMSSLPWMDVQPLFCDVDPVTHHIKPEHVVALLDDPDVGAIFPVHIWGNICDSNSFEKLAWENGIDVLYDAAHAFGCVNYNRKLGGHGVLEIFSFNPTNILSTVEGGCVCTNDDMVAERLRNLRSSYGRRNSVAIPINGNGRFSEAQAAMGLLCLEQYYSIVQKNKVKFDLFNEGLAGISGIRILQPVERKHFNYQSIVIEIERNEYGLAKNELIRVLAAENLCLQKPMITSPSEFMRTDQRFIQKRTTFPVAERLRESTIVLNINQNIPIEDVRIICKLIKSIHYNAEKLKGILSVER